MKDFFGKDCSPLKDKRLFLFDVDGTLSRDKTVFDGTLALLDYITAVGGKYALITNNSSTSVKDYIVKMSEMKIPADESNFFTATQAAVAYLGEKWKGRKIFCLGTKSFVEEMRQSGYAVSEQVCDDAEMVLVAYDTELNYAKIRATCEMLGKDIPFVATNPDLVCPATFGFVPDCGSICQMLENATSRKPLFVGKPSAVMPLACISRFGFSKEQTVVVGDRLYTDIACGINAEVDTVCVLTGEATPQEIEKTEFVPTFTFVDVKDLLAACKN